MKMAINNQITDSQIQQKAAEFLIRSFSGNATADDERELTAWLAMDERHRVAYQRMLNTWDEADALESEFTDDLEKPEAYAEHSAKSLLSTWRPWAVAAVMMLAVLTSVIWLIGQDSETGIHFARYTTAVGEQKTVALVDGSTVTLNTDTRLIVDYSGTYRRLILDKGEAFFDVAKDRERPFTVAAGAQSVTALGTKFNVKRVEAELTVAVAEGVVAVHETRDLDGATGIIAGQAVPNEIAFNQEDGQFRLDAGVVATFAGTSQVVQQQVALSDIERVYSWREGLLRFDGDRLDHVVSELERYMVRDVEIDMPTIGELNISGVFRLDDEEGIWRGLEAVLPVEVYEYPDRVVIAARSVRDD